MLDFAGANGQRRDLRVTPTPDSGRASAGPFMHGPPSPRMVTLPLLGAVLLAIAIFPSPQGYDQEWLFGTGLIAGALGLCMAALVRLGRWKGFERLAPLPQVGLALLVALLAAGSQLMVVWGFAPHLLEYDELPAPAGIEVVGNAVLLAISSYAFWVMAFRYPELLRQASLRALETERLRLRADETERRARFAPHFLLNTLNAIAGRVSREPEEAQELIGTLGDLLSVSLYDDERAYDLGRELEALQAYAALMKARFGPRLRFEFDVPEGLRPFPLPKLLLQPLLENAAVHGALPARSDTPIRLSARLEDGLLHIRLENPRPQPPVRREGPGGTGLDLVKQRLALLDPPGQLELRPGDGRFEVRLKLARPPG